MTKPLVSVLIPNYNYGRYLGQCLDSVLAQTYENIEIVLSDNNSTDYSYEIAQKYERAYPEKVFIRRNARNLGSRINSNYCLINSHGDYVIWFSSDDVMNPDYIKKSVEIMENNPHVGFVISHRNLIDDEGNVTPEASFYNKSCIVPGDEQAAVFMMAGIGVPSQTLCRAIAMKWIENESIHFQIVGDWFANFVMACHSDMGYIKEPLLSYRIHKGSETFDTTHTCDFIFETYNLLGAFRKIATACDMQKVVARYPAAVEKLAAMSLRYCQQTLKLNNIEASRKYLHLANVFKPDIESDTVYKVLYECLSLNQAEIKKRLDSLNDNGVFHRVVSYNPPEGYRPL